jgi:hypothetical protein
MTATTSPYATPMRLRQLVLAADRAARAADNADAAARAAKAAHRDAQHLMFNTERELALVVECEFCHAAPGAYCTDEKNIDEGHQQLPPHGTRLEKARLLHTSTDRGRLTPMPATGSATQPVRITAAPASGSVVLIHGTTGTAYQRFYADGLFYPAGRSTGVSFEHLLSLAGDQGVLLVHDASLYERG